MKPAYKVVQKYNEFPEIVKVDVTDTEGVSWREAKKQCRKIILDAARDLRGLTEEVYFAEYNGGN